MKRAPNRYSAVSAALSASFLASLAACSLVGCSSSDTGVDPNTTDASTAKDSGEKPTDAQAPADARVADSSGDSSADGGTVYPDPLAGIGAPTQVMGTYNFTEGPLWFGTKLLFSDVQANKIYQLVPPATQPSVFRDPSGNANGNAVGPDGALYTCEHSGKRIAKTVGTTVTTLVGMFNGQPLNSPNDIIVRGDGTVYFTDPNYAGTTQPKQNVFRVSPAGVLSVVDEALDKPNGIAFTTDQKHLYVASTSTNTIYIYDVSADGAVSNKKKFVDVQSPDGLAVDDADNVYVASTKIEVFKANATKVGSITVPQQPSNVAFGGADRKTLFITARTDVYQVAVNVAGPP